MPLILIPPYRFTALASAVQAAYGVDPYYDQVVYLNHFEGLSAGTTFTDVIGHPITRSGSVTISTSAFKVGTSSAAFTGTAGSTLISKSVDFALGTGDFTIEGWLWFGALGSGSVSRGVFQLSTNPTNNGFSASNANTIALISDSQQAGKLALVANGVSTVTTFTPSTVAGAFFHAAIVRASGVTKLFINGVEQLSFTDTTNYTGDTLGMGSFWDINSPFNGNIDEFRITKGAARYTAAFTPTTTAFPDKRSERTFNLSTLTAQASNSSFLDASTNNVAITTTGTPSQGVYSPFSSKGWTVRFNGTTDYIRVQPVAPALNNYSSLGTQNWTIDGWYTFNDTTRTGDQTLFTIGAEPWGGATPYIRLYWTANAYGTGLGRIWSEEATTSAGVWNTGGAFNPVPGRPYHIAFGRFNNVIRIFINGSLLGSVNYTPAHQNFATLSIGAMYYKGNNQDFMTGSVSNFRMRVGEGYGAPFEVPTTLPTATAGTYVMLAHAGAFVDGGPQRYEVKTSASIPALVMASPFQPDTYSANTHGGAVYFDGVADRLGLGTTSAFNFSSGTFTISFWINPLTAPAAGNTCRLFLSGANQSSDAFVLQMNPDLSLSAYVPLNGSVTSVSSAAAIKLGVWQHVEFVCSAGSMRMFVNGRLIGGPTSITVPTSNNALSAFIGYEIYGTADHKFKGWLSDFRITNTADHTAAFAVPTAPSAVNANTKLKLNFTNAKITDLTNGATVALHGAITTSNAKTNGGYSMVLNGSSYAEVIGCSPTVSAGLNPGDLGTDDFTISFWMNSSVGSQHNSALSTQTVVGSGTAGMWRVSTMAAGNGLYFHYATGTRFYDLSFSGANMHDGVWHHVAMVRSAGMLTAYVDGAQVGASQAMTQNLNSNRPLLIGYQANSNVYWNGQIDSIEITKNGAMFNGPFTPPNKDMHSV